MNIHLKKQIVAGLLVAFAIWPLVQGGIVRSTGMPPQQLGGWAQYAKPWFAPQVVLWKQQANTWRPINGSDVPEPVRPVAMQFFGELTRDPGASPDALGQQLRQHLRGVSAIRVEVQRFSLDLDTASIDVELDSHVYE